MAESSSSPRRSGARRPPGRSGSGRVASSPMVELAAIETPPELILFNAYLSAEKDLERERQRLRQAEVAKEKAAAHLKELQSRGSREDVAAAEVEYRQRVEEWKRVRDGEPPEPTGEAPDSGGESGEDAATGSAGAAVEADHDAPDAEQVTVDADDEQVTVDVDADADDADAAGDESGASGGDDAPAAAESDT